MARVVPTISSSNPSHESFLATFFYRLYLLIKIGKNYVNIFLNGATPASFFIFVLFKHQFYRKKTVGFSGIQTLIVGVEGEHADHLTTTTMA